MAKGEKVKIDSKTTPPPSHESEMDSSDESSDVEANQIVSDMDKQSRDFMARLIVELEKCQDTLNLKEVSLRLCVWKWTKQRVS
jgi:hypothetical protein